VRDPAPRSLADRRISARPESARLTCPSERPVSPASITPSLEAAGEHLSTTPDALLRDPRAARLVQVGSSDERGA